MVNITEVCFGAWDNSYGTFSRHQNGGISSFKLVHLRGKVSCGTDQNRFTNWGCDVGKNLMTFLTDASNKIVFPLVSKIKPYKISGIWSNSTELIFNNLAVPVRVSPGQQFRCGTVKIWKMCQRMTMEERRAWISTRYTFKAWLWFALVLVVQLVLINEVLWKVGC